MAGRARDFLSTPRSPGDAARLRMSDLSLMREGRMRDMTVIDIVNDNRPFLLDSTLAALTAQGSPPTSSLTRSSASSAMAAAH